MNIKWQKIQIYQQSNLKNKENKNRDRIKDTCNVLMVASWEGVQGNG